MTLRGLWDRIRMLYRPNVRCPACDDMLQGVDTAAYGGVQFCSDSCLTEWKADSLAM